MYLLIHLKQGLVVSAAGLVCERLLVEGIAWLLWRWLWFQLQHPKRFVLEFVDKGRYVYCIFWFHKAVSITFNNTWIASIVAPCDQLSAQNMFYLLFSSCFIFPVECVFILLYDLIEAWQQVKRTTKMIESLGKMNHDSWFSKKKSRSWTAHLYWIAKQLPRLEKGSALYCHGWLARNPLSSRNVIAF